MPPRSVKGASSRSSALMPAEAAMTSTMRSSHHLSLSVNVDAGLFLLGEPAGVPLADDVGVGDELVVDADGVADQRHQVGQGVPVGCAGRWSASMAS